MGARFRCIGGWAALLALFALGEAPASALAQEAPAGAPIAFTGARIIAELGEPPIERGTLLVEGGRVRAVGPADAVAIPAGARRVELAGRTLLPGLINAHAHVGSTRGLVMAPESYSEANVLEQLATYARYGVTTVVSLGRDREAGVRVRDAQDAALSRARLFVAGPMVDARTPEAARAQVEALARMRVDFAKIRVDDDLGTSEKLPPQAYAEAIRAAHALGLRAAAHIYYLADAKAVLRAGADLLAHGVRDAPVDAELVALLRERGACVVPALTREVATFVYAERPAFFDDPFLLREADPAVLRELERPERQRQVAQNPATAVARTALRTAQANLKALSAAGIPIAFGTDSAVPGRFPGYFEHLELERMAEAGLTPEQILRAATRDAARCIGQSSELGALTPGHWADFAVLRADPLADVRALRELDSVWIAGNRVPPRGVVVPVEGH